jgi:hypothetical protein
MRPTLTFYSTKEMEDIKLVFISILCVTGARVRANKSVWNFDSFHAIKRHSILFKTKRVTQRATYLDYSVILTNFQFFFVLCKENPSVVFILRLKSFEMSSHAKAKTYWQVEISRNKSRLYKRLENLYRVLSMHENGGRDQFHNYMHQILSH